MLYQIIYSLVVKIKDSLPKGLFANFLILPNQRKNYPEDFLWSLGQARSGNRNDSKYIQILQKDYKSNFHLKRHFLML